MKVELLSLDELRAQAQAADDKTAFARQYPGVFMVAMGLLSAELLGSRTRAGTTALIFGDRPRHQMGQPHPLAGLAFFLRSSEQQLALVLGRGASCDLTIPDPSVSERHCRIQVTDRGVEAVDLGSRNGTNINLLRLSPDQPALLGDEDILTLGRYSFQLMSSVTFYSALRLLEVMAGKPQS